MGGLIEKLIECIEIDIANIPDNGFERYDGQEIIIYADGEDYYIYRI